MAEPSAEMDAGEQARTWERNSTRQAILDAARRLAAREGIEAVTLSRVAAEAGFAPPAVYTYFVSREDLHLAVVAEDLDQLAQTMRGETPPAQSEPDEAADEGDPNLPLADIIAFQPSASEDDESAVDEDIPTESIEAELDEAAEIAAAAELLDESAAPDEEDIEAGQAEDLSAAEPEADDADPDVSLAEIEQAIGVVLASDDDDFVEADAIAEPVPDAFPEDADADEADADAVPDPSLSEEPQPEYGVGSGDFPAAPQPALSAAGPMDQAAEIAQLKEAVARLEARPVDAWLERRLRVFERTLADIEGRMEKTERDAASALSAVSEGFKALDAQMTEALDDVSRQLSDSGQHHGAAAADLRLYVKDLAGRLSSVEASFTRLLSGHDAVGAEHEAWVEPEAPSVELEPEVGPVSVSQGAPRALHQAEGDSYLNVARRAANSAATAEQDRARNPLSYLKMASAASPGFSISRRGLQILAGGLTLLVLVIILSIALGGGSEHEAVPQHTGAVTTPVAASPDARVAALAKAGNAQAELVVGLKLLNGDGVATDIPSAAYWLKKAAAQHQPVAEYWLGTLYERGRGVAKDRAKAMQVYEEAAKAGNAKAMYRLGVGYAEGWNGEPNYSDAAGWFKKSAELGVIDAQFNLAVLYERGSGVPQSFVHAFKWYAIAAAQGDAVSKARIDALAEQLSSSDVATAQAAAAKFHPAVPVAAANVEPSVEDVSGMK